MRALGDELCNYLNTNWLSLLLATALLPGSGCCSALALPRFATSDVKHHLSDSRASPARGWNCQWHRLLFRSLKNPCLNLRPIALGKMGLLPMARINPASSLGGGWEGGLTVQGGLFRLDTWAYTSPPRNTISQPLIELSYSIQKRSSLPMNSVLLPYQKYTVGAFHKGTGRQFSWLGHIASY